MSCDIARARDNRRLALNILALMFQHIAQEIDRAIAGRLWPHLRAAIFLTLARQHTLPAIGDALILAKHIADLAPANANIACWHIGIRADMAVEFGHKALAKPHDFCVRFAARVKVCPALAAAHWQASEGVFEGLLKS